MIPLQFLAINLTSPSHVAEANETMLTVKANTNDNATKPTFRFDFGDGTDRRESFLNTASHMYHFIGNYTMNVQAWSLCNTSMLTAIANISVPKPVRILKNISLHSEATVFGESTQFRLLLEQGSDFTCLWFLGDNVNHTISRSNPGAIIFNHVYLALGTYTAHVTCKNRRSELPVSATVEVQKVILGLKIYPVPPILFGTQFLLRWRIDDGTDVTYKANFSGISLEVVKSDDGLHGQAWVKQHDYKTPGEFLVHVAASNAITKWVSTRGKCIILRSVVPFSPMVFHKNRDIEINETVSVSFTDVNSVFDINASYIVGFGDKSEVLVTRDTFANHSYSHYGLYTVNITADNEVSSLSTSIIIKVHKPVLKLQGAIIPSVVAKVNQTVNITMFLFSGSDFVCQWQFGDGQQLVQNEELIYFKESELSVKSFTNVTISASHVFKEVGIYEVSATCQNRLSQINNMAYTTVQEEITLFQVSTVAPVIFGKTFFLNFTFATGTNVTFRAFLNRQQLYIEHQKFYHLSKVTPYIYKQPGQFNLTIKAQNLVSPLLRHRQMIFIEIPVSGVRINMSYLHANILHAGHGVNMNIFPEKVPVVLQATAENGTSLQYTWSISTVKDLLKNKTVMHTFHSAGIYMVSLHAENRVSRAASVVVVAVQKRASFSQETPVECSSPKVLNEVVTVKTTIKNLGTNSTLRIDVDNTTSYWYGDYENYLELARNNVDTNVQYKGSLKENIILDHVYNTPGIYTIKAILGNAVTKSLRTCEVEVLPRPCKKPTVKLTSVGDTPEDATSFFTADVINIEANVDVFCPESKESKYEWNIFQSNQRTGLFEHFNGVSLNEEASMKEIRLKRRSLPVGLFRVSLTVGMVEEELKDFLTVAEGYIRVVQSPLIAEIRGGSEIRRGFGSVVFVDGKNSYDPDVGPGNYTGVYNFSFCIVLNSFSRIVRRIPNIRKNFGLNDNQPLRLSCS